MAKKVRKYTAEEKAAHKQLESLLAAELPAMGMKRGLTRFRQRRGQSERFAAKMWAQYQAEGGEEGTGKPFLEWLKSLNWPAIIAFIMTLFA